MVFIFYFDGVTVKTGNLFTSVTSCCGPDRTSHVVEVSSLLSLYYLRSSYTTLETTVMLASGRYVSKY